MCSSTLLVTTSVFTLKLFTLYYSSSLSYNYCSLGKNKIMLVFSDRPKLIVSSITSLDKNWRSLNNSKNPFFFRTDYCSTYYCIPRLYNSIYNGLCSKKKSVRGPTSTYNYSQSVELLNSICSRDQPSKLLGQGLKVKT